MCVRHTDEGNYGIVNKHQLEKDIFLLDGLTPMKTSVRLYTDFNREVSLPLVHEGLVQVKHYRQKVGNWITIKSEKILKRMTAS